MTGAVTTLLKPHIFRFHPTVSHQASLSGSHTTGKLTVQSSHPQPCPLSPHILSYSPASWLLTPFTWLFGPDVLRSGYPLTSLLSLDSDLALADEPSRTWLLTTFLFLLDAAPLCITLPSPVSTFPPNYTSVPSHMLVHLLSVPFPCLLKTRNPNSCLAYLKD